MKPKKKKVIKDIDKMRKNEDNEQFVDFVIERKYGVQGLAVKDEYDREKESTKENEILDDYDFKELKYQKKLKKYMTFYTSIDDLVEKVVRKEKLGLVVGEFFVPFMISILSGFVGGLMGAGIAGMNFLYFVFLIIFFIKAFHPKPQKDRTYKNLKPSERQQFLDLFKKETRGPCVTAFIIGVFVWWGISLQLVRYAFMS